MQAKKVVKKKVKRLARVEVFEAYIPNKAARFWGDLQGAGRKSLMLFISKKAADHYCGKKTSIKCKVTVEYEISDKEGTGTDARCPRCAAIQTNTSIEIRALRLESGAPFFDECARPGCTAFLSFSRRGEYVFAKAIKTRKGQINEEKTKQNEAG